MKLSIVVPCYNSQDYIYETLASIKQQEETMTSIEVILLDDASTDKTLSVIHEFIANQESSRISWQVVPMDENQGQGRLRNKGMALAKGDYVFFMDSDDILGKDSLSRVFKKLANQNRLIDSVQFQWAYFDHVTHKVNRSRIGKEADGTLWIGEECEQLLAQDIYYPVNRLYSREFLLKEKIRFGEGYIYEDVEFFVAVATKAQSLLNLRDLVYFVRLHQASTTGDLSNKERHYSDFKHVINVTLAAFHPRKSDSWYYLLRYFLLKGEGYMPRFPMDTKDNIIELVLTKIVENQQRITIPENESSLVKSIFLPSEQPCSVSEAKAKIKKDKCRTLPMRVIGKIKRGIKSEKVWIYQL